MAFFIAAFCGFVTLIFIAIWLDARHDARSIPSAHRSDLAREKRSNVVYGLIATGTFLVAGLLGG